MDSAGIGAIAQHVGLGIPVDLGWTYVNSKAVRRRPALQKHFLRDQTSRRIHFAKLWVCARVLASLLGSRPSLAAEHREDGEEQAQDNAEDDAGDDRKIKCRMLALDPDIARQSSQPFRSEAAPHDQSDQRRDYTDDQDKFPQLAHNSKSCANRAKAQA